MAPPSGSRSVSRALPALVVLGGTLLSCIAIGGHLPSFAGSRLLFDGHDIGVYFRSSRWLVEGGPLYREVFS